MADLNILDSDSKEHNNDSKFSSGEKKLIAGIAQWTKLIGVFSFIPLIYFAIDIFLGINLISSFSSIGILEIIFILVYLAICLVIISGLINLIRF